jgi:hypothetical protein
MHASETGIDRDQLGRSHIFRGGRQISIWPSLDRAAAGQLDDALAGPCLGRRPPLPSPVQAAARLSTGGLGRRGAALLHPPF